MSVRNLTKRAAAQLQFGYLQVDTYRKTKYVTGKAGFEENYISHLRPCARM
jgi:hypothetical protein